MLRKKIITTFLVTGLCVGFIFGMRTLRPNPEEVMKKRLAQRSAGNPDSKTWITEYFDYQCPPCSLAAFLLSEHLKTKPDSIYLQVRYYPLQNHPHAMKAATYAECASRQPGKFWKFHDLLMSKQKEWSMEKYPELKFLTYAKEAGLDLETWDRCTKDPEVSKFITDEKNKAIELGVKITPSFFVNGELIVGVKSLQDALSKSTEVAKPHE